MNGTKRRLAAGFGTLATALTLALGGSNATAVAEDGYPDLQVTAAFDKAAYDSGDVVHVTMTITNTGSTAAEDVFVLTDGFSLYLDEPGWGDLGFGGEPARIDAGATRVVELSGTMVDPRSGVLTFAGRVVPLDPTYENNLFSISAPVTLTYGDFTGTVIEDRNGNGAADPGEGIPGVHVTMNGGAPYWFYDQVTDVHGRFFFDDLPTGRYVSYYGGEGGWVVGPEYPDEDRWVISSGANPDAVVVAVRPISDKLIVTAEFAQPTHRVGDAAHVALTIRNRTGTVLTGIHAHCNGIGNANQFNGVGLGWAQFAQDGPGATLAAGETRTFDVYEAVPDAALRYGYVALGCEIGPGAGTGVRGLPFASARAKVPGATTSFTTRIIDNRDGGGIPGTKVALLDEGTHDVITTGITDAQGRFPFANVPAGVYELRVVGPWSSGGYPLVFEARADYPGFELTFGLDPRTHRPG